MNVLVLISLISLVTIPFVIAINQPLGLTYVLILILSAITLYPFFVKIVKKKLDFFEASFVFSAGYLFTYPFSMIFTIMFLKHYFQLTENLINLMNKMLLFAIIGIIFYNLGYLLDFSKIVKKFPLLKDRWNFKRTLNISLFLLLIGILAFIIILNKLGVIYLLTHLYMRAVILSKYSYLTALTQVIVPALLAIYLIFFKYRKFLGFPIFITFIVLIILVFFGGRFRIFSVLVMIFSLYNYIKKRIEIRHVVFLILFGFLVFLALYLRNYSYSFKSLKDVIVQVSINNFNYPYFFLKVIENTPSKIPYQYGKTFISLLFYPFPRSVFPAKPLSAGPLITRYLFPNLKYSSVPPTILGEFYLNFSYIGIIAGMFLLGILHKIMYSYFINNSKNTTNIYIYSILVPFFFWCNFLDFTLTAIYALILIIPAVVICLYATGGKDEEN